MESRKVSGQKVHTAPKVRVQQAWELEPTQGGFRIPPPPADLVRGVR